MSIELLTPFTRVELQINTISKNQQIGLMIGNFNPIHNAHLAIADQVCQTLDLDKVLFMPKFTDNDNIIKMLEIALYEGDMRNLGLDLSLYKNSNLSILQVLKELIKANPEIDFYLIMGSDEIAGLIKWNGINDLLNLVQLVGVQRYKYKIGTSYPIIWIDIPMLDISSTSIRNQIRDGYKPNYFLPKKVLDYILREGIYG